MIKIDKIEKFLLSDFWILLHKFFKFLRSSVTTATTHISLGERKVLGIGKIVSNAIAYIKIINVVLTKINFKFNFTRKNHTF